MADLKISQLDSITVLTPATNVLPVVDSGGVTKKITTNQLLGSGGTATLASATITGDLTVDTSTLKVDSTNNRVGIGTATPANTLEVVAPAGDNIVSTFRSGDATAANNAGGGFRSISSATAASRVAQIWLDADGANLSGGDYFFIQKNGSSGTVEFNQSSNAAMTFLTNGTERARIDSSGNVGITNGNLILGTSGKGIDFSAVTGGTGTATGNVLNDYEEGTFTPAVTGSTSAGTATYVGRSGKYTKIGNLVQVQIFIDYNSHTGTGDTRITGLPFTNGANFSAASVGYANGLAVSAGYYVQAYVDASQSFILLNQAPTGGGVNQTVPIDPAATLVITATYTI